MISDPIHDLAEAMAAHLEAHAPLAGVDVIVDRQKDIESMVAGAIEKSRGLCITIGFLGFSNAADETPGPLIQPRFAVRCWGLPILNGDDGITADFAAMEVARALHLALLDSAEHSFERLYVEDGDLVPDASFLIYELTVRGRLQL